MPLGPIVDSHVHLWDPTRFRMSWLDGNGILDKPYGLTDYRAHTQGVDVEAIVYLQVEVNPPYSLLEAQWVADLDDAGSPSIGAIVPWAPLEDGEHARSFIEALVAIDPRIRGIRRLYQDEPNIDFCVQPEFIRGVRLLPEYNLSFDLCLKHPQLANTIEFVRSCPKVSFVLDHIAKPDIKAGLLDPWRTEIRQLAAFPNVLCKLSGMVTEADTQHWTIDDLRPYYETIYGAFGEDRVMFGGDWPVVLTASRWRRWADTLDELTASLSETQKRKLWRENARRFYRID
jgi:L-fuconolactonase